MSMRPGLCCLTEGFMQMANAIIPIVTNLAGPCDTLLRQFGKDRLVTFRDVSNAF